MTLIENRAKRLGDDIDRALLRAGFSEWRSGSRRFQAHLAEGCKAEVLTMISRTLPIPTWSVDFGIELISSRLSDWLRAHSTYYRDEHRFATTTMSKLRGELIDLPSFLAEPGNVSRLIKLLNGTLAELAPRVATFEGLCEQVRGGDGAWTITFEGQLAMEAMQTNLDAACLAAERRLDMLRLQGQPQHVLHHQAQILEHFSDPQK